MSEPSLNERLEALAAFVPIFEAQNFFYGNWHNPPGRLPWFDLSADAVRFVSTSGRYGWVVPDIDWPAWQQSAAARQLLTNTKSIERASVADLEYLLTTHIRLDRFNEGHLASAFASGHLLAISRRAAALLQEGEAFE